MTNEGFTKIAFNALDRITDIFPPFGSRVFQKIFVSVIGSSNLYRFVLRKYREKLFNTTDFKKILFIADVNIGDSINSQPCIEILRKIFPDSQIDYVCNKIGGEVISNSPLINNVFKIYSNSGLPLKEDAFKIKDIVEKENYSLILNMSPFLKKKMLRSSANLIQIYFVFAFYVIYLWKKKSLSLNESFITDKFFRDFLLPLKSTINPVSNENENNDIHGSFNGNKIYISDNDLGAAEDFLIKNSLFSAKRMILFNLTVTTKFSMIPMDIQLQIIKDALLCDDINAVLIYKGNSSVNIEEMVTGNIPLNYADKLVTIPNTFTLSEFTVLIDFCDMFVSGDTGTVHIAASRKINADSGNALRNRTSVVSVFGASESKIYGYDSVKFGHSPANQDAPSKAFVGDVLCRNITCINRLIKTCREVRCFRGIKAEDISSYIISRFGKLKADESISENIKVYENGTDTNTQ